MILNGGWGEIDYIHYSNYLLVSKKNNSNFWFRYEELEKRVKKSAGLSLQKKRQDRKLKKILLGDNTLQIMITLSISKTILPPSRNVSNLLLL